MVIHGDAIGIERLRPVVDCLPSEEASCGDGEHAMGGVVVIQPVLLWYEHDGRGSEPLHATSQHPRQWATGDLFCVHLIIS